MGSSDNSTNESEPRQPLFTNPLSTAFMSLFGVPMGFNADPDISSFQISGTPGNQMAGQLGPDGEPILDNEVFPVSPFANQLFGPGTFDALADQLNPVQQSPFANMAMQGLGGADSIFGDTIGLFQNQLLPSATELATTGARTDIDPIRQQMMREFNQHTVPDLANQFSTLGGGGQNQAFSDFNQAALRAGGDVFTDLGALQFQADESAANRRLQGLGAANTFGQVLTEMGTQRAAFPTALGADVLALQEQNIDQQLLNRPGGLLMNFLNNLMGVTQPDPLLIGNSSSGQRDSFSIL